MEKKQSKEKIKLSLIIPAYNEEKIIKSTLEKVISYLKKQRYSWEIIVSDDGSKDKTASIVKEFKDRNVNLVSLAKNMGKGAALREGVRKARGKFIIYSDADLSVSLKNINKFLKDLERKGCVIASRRVKGAKIAVHQSWIRENMGRVFTLLTKIILTMNISDFTCGFKGFKRNVAKKVFEKGKIKRWAYDSEILFLVKKYGFSIEQVPVEWRNREDTRVELHGVILDSFYDLVRIRINDILGKYD